MGIAYRSRAGILAAAAAIFAGTAAPSAAALVPVPTDNAFAIPGASADFWAPALADRVDPWATDGSWVLKLNERYYDCGGCTPVVVDYPRTMGPLFGPGAPFADDSIAIGVGAAVADVHNAVGPSVISGLSLGSITADAAQHTLDSSPLPPDSPKVSFIVASDPSRVTPFSTAVGALLPTGWRVPLLGWTVTRPPSDSMYDTVVVVGEYDFFADFPDRPWNLLAVLNTAFGSVYQHSQAALSSPAEVPPSNIATTTNSMGATTTTYLVPSPVLPLIRPLSLILPAKVITAANTVLKPIVDRGYSRYDTQTGNRMPYLQPTENLPKLVRHQTGPTATQRPGRIQSVKTLSKATGYTSLSAGKGSARRA